METEIPSRPQLTAPEIIESMRINYSRGPEEMDMGQFWGDIASLGQTGALKTKGCSQLMRFLGQQPHIATDLIVRLKDVYSQQDLQSVEHYLDMAYVLGLEKNRGMKSLFSFLEEKLNPPERSRLEIAFALITLGVTATALATPALMVLNQYLQTSVQTAEQTIPSSTPRPTETPAPTPEIRVEPRDLFREVIAPQIYQKVVQMREERARSDPDYLQRASPELNKNRINLVVLGGRKEDSLADTILILSYHLPSHTVSLISIPRDLQSPEVLRKTNDVYNSRINQAFGEGGFSLAKLALENATGLSADLTMRANFDVLVDLIDQTVGYVEVDLDKAINDPTYPALKGSEYESFSIAAGKQRLDGATALEVARSRHGSSDYDRAERQRQIVMAFFKRVLEEGSNNPIRGAQILQTINGILQQKAQEGTFQPDFDINMLLLSNFGQLIQNTPSILWQQVFGGGWRIAKQPSFSSLGIDNQNLVVGAGVSNLSITKIRGGNPNTTNPRQEYWGPVRNLVQKSLTGKLNF